MSVWVVRVALTSLAIGFAVALLSIKAIQRTALPFPKWIAFFMVIIAWPVRVQTIVKQYFLKKENNENIR